MIAITCCLYYSTLKVVLDLREHETKPKEIRHILLVSAGMRHILLEYAWCACVINCDHEWKKRTLVP